MPAAGQATAPADVIALIGLGSNLGDVVATLRWARRRLSAQPGISEVQASSLYRTAPLGLTDQPDFLNAVLRLRTTLAAEALLDLLLALESEQGRTRGSERNGPRTLDLDLLLHGDAVQHTARLTLPHPRLTARAFVLAPLAELLGTEHRLQGRTVGDWLSEVETQRVLRLLPPDAWA